MAAAAAEALAFHGQAPAGTNWLEGLLADTKPEVRRAGWRVNGQLGLIRGLESFESGLTDTDPQLRSTAFAAAAWTRQTFLIPCCRTVAANGKPGAWDAALLLAILGKQEDLSHILNLGTNPNLGHQRCRLLGAYGHPDTVEELLRGMVGPDLRTARGRWSGLYQNHRL